VLAVVEEVRIRRPSGLGLRRQRFGGLIRLRLDDVLARLRLDDVLARLRLDDVLARLRLAPKTSNVQQVRRQVMHPEGAY
jgi:hypothetical protein